MKVGFIGVGNMGGPMCRNIIKRSNHQVTVFDLNPASVKTCTDLGGSAAKSIAEATKGADLVMTSLPMPKDVEAVALGVPVHVVSAVTGQGCDALRARLAPGTTAVLVGSSGVGKSTLVNRFAGTDRMQAARFTAAACVPGGRRRPAMQTEAAQ